MTISFVIFVFEMLQELGSHQWNATRKEMSRYFKEYCFRVIILALVVFLIWLEYAPKKEVQCLIRKKIISP